MFIIIILDGDEINYLDLTFIILNIRDYTKGHGLENQIVMLSSLKIVTFGLLVVIEKWVIIITFFIIIAANFSSLLFWYRTFNILRA